MKNRAFSRFMVFSLLLAALCLGARISTAQNAQRLGLHVTKDELAIWQKRAENGPYKTKGDTQKNSPGDWNRITRQAREFLQEPSSDRFTGYPGAGCVPKGDQYEPRKNGGKMRDAAFVYLVTGDTTYSNAVRQELLAQADEKLVDFSNGARWCYLGDSNPVFIIAEWMTRLLFAYDYTKDTFSPAERQRLDRWFLNAGLYYQRGLDQFYEKWYVDRLKGNYQLTKYCQQCQKQDPLTYMYFGSPAVGFFARGYNNRNGSIARFIGTLGVFLDNQPLQESAKRWFMEWMRYGVYPGGDISDMARGTEKEQEPQKGLNYAFSLAQCMADLADVMARNGDNSLYEYSTEEGYFGSESPDNPKNLHQILVNTLNYLNGTNIRYATTNVQQRNNPQQLISNVDPYLKNSNAIVFDTWFSLPNLYYQDKTIQANYLRMNTGTQPYPEYPRSTGPNQPWSGHAAIYPGMLFMFGKMEGKVNPYPKGPNGNVLKGSLK